VSSSIPIALHEAMKQGRAKAGDKVLLAAFGVGLSWAGTIIQL
jgi:3-oxoacyl-[acyl-carrier-protein] synthase-3